MSWKNQLYCMQVALPPIGSYRAVRFCLEESLGQISAKCKLGSRLELTRRARVNGAEALSTNIIARPPNDSGNNTPQPCTTPLMCPPN